MGKLSRMAAAICIAAIPLTVGPGVARAQTKVFCNELVATRFWSVVHRFTGGVQAVYMMQLQNRSNQAQRFQIRFDYPRPQNTPTTIWNLVPTGEQIYVLGPGSADLTPNQMSSHTRIMCAPS